MSHDVGIEWVNRAAAIQFEFNDGGLAKESVMAVSWKRRSIALSHSFHYASTECLGFRKSQSNLSRSQTSQDFHRQAQSFIVPEIIRGSLILARVGIVSTLPLFIQFSLDCTTIVKLRNFIPLLLTILIHHPRRRRSCASCVLSKQQRHNKKN